MHDEGSTESEEQNDPDEQDLDENTDDDEDIEDEPTESYFMDDEWIILYVLFVLLCYLGRPFSDKFFLVLLLSSLE